MKKKTKKKKDKKEKKKFIFKPRARILLQLGDELIRNESVAVLELVKNSYDALATKVILSMNSVDDKIKGTITVEDNGTGMDLNIVENVWMEPGSEYKQDLLKEAAGKQTKFARTVLGEKGIGRFAVHKLGDVIELTTKKKGKPEVFIKIDWRSFGKKKYLREVPIDVSERKPKIFTGNKCGTKIVVKKIRNSWTSPMLREVYRSFNSLRSPFDSPTSFDISFHTDKLTWLEGLPSWKEIKGSALFQFKCEIEGKNITKFKYEFKPWPSMNKLLPRTVTEKGTFGKLMLMKDKDGEIDLSGFRVGKISFDGYIFDRDPTILKLGTVEKKSVREYLDHNGGIRVYRDGIRIYDYGEPGNDWLNLDLRRVNVPAVRISNNIMIAAVSLDRKSSMDLKEKTNREGFIENDAYDVLKRAVVRALGLVEQQRRKDKQKIRNLYGPTQKSEPVLAKIILVKKTIEKKVKDRELKEELTGYMNTIESDYKLIHETLLRGAGAGLSLGVAVHEIEKIVDELNHIVKAKKMSKQMSALIKHLSEIVAGYTLTLRKSSMQDWKAWSLVDQATFNFNLRFKAHNIHVERANLPKSKNLKLKCARSHIVGSLMNLLDNSIWWLDYVGIKNKKILVGVYADSPRTVTILIADNGTGFALPTDDITEPFVSAKPDGMGLGLHIAKEIMLVHHGSIHFPTWGEYNIPKEFRGGAIVALTFPLEPKK